MTTRNLRGHIPAATAVTTPLTILREQAGLLGELTDGVLEGDVQARRSAKGDFTYTLYIVAPGLDRYHHAIVEVEHPVAMYPVSVLDDGTGKGYMCADEEMFVRVLQRILTSDHVRKVIAALLAQSLALR